MDKESEKKTTLEVSRATRKRLKKTVALLGHKNYDYTINYFIDKEELKI